MASRRREDRLHDDRFKLWVPQEKQPDRDYESRRHRSSTVPATQTHDSRSHPTRAYRQEAHYTSAAPSASYQPAPGPSSSRTLPRSSSAQYPSTPNHLATPYQGSAPLQPPQPKGYPTPTASSRRPQPDALDSRSYSNRRPTPTHKSSYEHVSSAEDVGRSSRQPFPSRPVQPSTQTTANTTTPWPSSAQDIYSKRSKDRDKERDRHREAEKERDRERATAELDRDRHRERYRSETHREKDRAIETDRQSRHRREKRMESDSEGLVYSDNASKASISGREAYQPSIRESISSHRRHRTEDGISSTTSTGPQAEVITQSNTAGVGSNPPPAPRVMPVYLPQKPSKSHHERHTSAAHGAQSGSDTERTSLKHRMERNHSGGPVQRGDGYVSSAVKERQGQDAPLGPREDAKSKSEAKYSSSQGAYYDSRQPQKPASVHTVDIPLITPGFNSSPLPYESRGHSQSALHKDEPQGAGYPHASLASAVKPSHGRSQSSEVPRSRTEQPPLDRSRTDPAAADLSHGRHNRSEDFIPPQSVSRYPQITSTAVEHQPRSAHKTSFSTPPAVSGPRPQPATPAPGPIATVASSQPPVAPLPAHKTNSSPPKISSAYGSLPSAYPTPMSSQTHLVSGNHGSNATAIHRSPSTPPSHSTSMNTSQTMMTASQSSRRPPHPNFQW
ncbi:hypothetical protein DFH29DRAFT_232968 [Suillus ampliporus]|nr:hypothetical protein DFH29DRAFT_232968 [Suillus ampliporus]